MCIRDRGSVMSSVDKTGSSATCTGLTSAGVFVGHIAAIPCVCSTVPVAISCVDINVPAITFGSIPLPTTDFAVPKSTVSYVRESSGLYPIARGVPGPEMSVSFTLVISSAAGCLKCAGDRDPFFGSTCPCPRRCGIFDVAPLAHPVIDGG